MSENFISCCVFRNWWSAGARSSRPCLSSVRCVVTNAKGKIPANLAQDGMVATTIQHSGGIVDVQD
jgi:hypothetical protein